MLTGCFVCEEEFAGQDPELFFMWMTNDGKGHGGALCAACAAKWPTRFN